MKVLQPLDLADIQTFKTAPGSQEEFTAWGSLPSTLSGFSNLCKLLLKCSLKHTKFS